MQSGIPGSPSGPDREVCGAVYYCIIVVLHYAIWQEWLKLMKQPRQKVTVPNMMSHTDLCLDEPVVYI
jgi:hypothetical protein